MLHCVVHIDMFHNKCVFRCFCRISVQQIRTSMRSETSRGFPAYIVTSLPIPGAIEKNVFNLNHFLTHIHNISSNFALRYNAREMGCLLASKIVRKYLDPFSADVDFYRPAVGSKSSSNREPTSASSSLVGVSTRRHMPVAVEALPTFLLPRTFCSRLPGGLFLVRSRLPVVGECTALVTGDMGSDSISVLKVCKHLKLHILRLVFT